MEPVSIEQEMRKSYLDYAMSVIVSRALPDARDGLKPVHRRILFAMNEAGNTPDKPYRKSARMTGDVMGKYHPHGDSAIYLAAVRMAQDFSMRLPLIDGQGNFGSIDGDMPAAMRYTEMRLAPSAMLLLDDIDKDTVDFQPNYDESEQEPRVLPAAFPNLLINGSNGIAVGMATNIPPHNPSEIMDATLALIAESGHYAGRADGDRAGAGFSDRRRLFWGVPASVRRSRPGAAPSPSRARASIEQIRKDRDAIVVTEIPYQVNKSTLLERIAELVRAKDIEGIADLRDESDRDGMRIVIELKRDATGEVVLNQLYRFTNLQTSFGINMLALDKGKPRQMGLKELLRLLCGIPRGGDSAARALRAEQGARPGASAGRPCHRRCEYRRGDQDHPRQPGCQHGARGADGARLAGGGCGAVAGADRRCRQHASATTTPCA